MSPLVLALLGILLVVEVGLLIWALVDLARRPASQVNGGNKLIWLIICLFLQLLGPILYLVVGRLQTPAGSETHVSRTQASEVGGTVASAAAALYDAAARDIGQATGEGLAAVELEGVDKIFGQTAALDGLTLRVPEGSVFGFLGPNGAGKTTALRILAGLARPTAGEVRILGRDVADGGAVREVIGYLPDVPAFYKWMTAPQYLRFAGSLFGLRGEALERRASALLDLAALDGVSTRIGGYSRGMKQRLGVAQALVNAPRLLLLDEPTSALDPIGRREVLDMIAALRGRTTVFFSTHILADVERVCDTVAIIDHGHVVQQAGIDELRQRGGGLHRLVVEVDDPQRLAEVLADRPWLRSAGPDGPTGLRLAVDDLPAARRELPAVVAELGLSLIRLDGDELSLEDVFVELLGGERA
jgi:ABC-2 type transport system ATP-binding protein